MFLCVLAGDALPLVVAQKTGGSNNQPACSYTSTRTRTHANTHTHTHTSNMPCLGWGFGQTDNPLESVLCLCACASRLCVRVCVGVRACI